MPLGIHGGSEGLVTTLQGAAWSLPGRVCSKNSNEVAFAEHSGSDPGHPSVSQQAESSGSKLRTHGKTHNLCDTMSPSQVNSGCWHTEMAQASRHGLYVCIDVQEH